MGHQTSKPVVVRQVQPNDGPAVHQLLCSIFPSVMVDPQRWLARWQWQYWDNPFRQDRPAGWVLTDGDRIVGHLGAVYLPWRAGSRPMTAVIGADYAVSPEAVARGGVFAALELAQLFFASAKDLLPLATTANEKTAAVFARFGCEPIEWTQEMWRAPASLPQLVRSCHGGRSRVARRLLLSRYGRHLLSFAAISYWLTQSTPIIPVPGSCRIEATVPKLIGNLETFVEQIGGATTDFVETVCGVERSVLYLQWRYQQHPEQGNIRFITIRDADNRVRAACTLFHELTERQSRCYLEEMFLPKDGEELAAGLFCAALQVARSFGADYLVTTTGLHRFRSLFWELGFESRSRSAPAVAVQSSALSDDFHSTMALQDCFEFWHAQMF